MGNETKCFALSPLQLAESIRLIEVAHYENAKQKETQQCLT
jgi:hypothetical protein